MKDQISKLLKEEFEKRKTENPKYSIRQFAEDLESNSATISQALNGKRNLSPGSLKKISKILNIDLKELASLKKKKDNQPPSYSKMKRVNTREYPVMDNWYVNALLNLSRMKNNSTDPKWIAERLNISEREAKFALKILVDLNYVEVKENRFVKKFTSFMVDDEVPTSTMLKYYKKQLEIGISNMTEKNMTDSLIVTTHIIMNKAQLVELEKLVGYFLRDLHINFENTDASEIYTFVVGSFLTKNQTNQS